MVCGHLITNQNNKTTDEKEELAVISHSLLI
jgi:hypothetical protein